MCDASVLDTMALHSRSSCAQSKFYSQSIHFTARHATHATDAQSTDKLAIVSDAAQVSALAVSVA